MVRARRLRLAGSSPIFLDHALAQQQGKFHIGNHLFVAGLKCSDLLQACHERRDPDLIGRIRKKVSPVAHPQKIGCRAVS